jgi:hypothetical protein
MTENQIENGYWIWDKKNNFPPESISYPTQYKGESRLNIACTQRIDITQTEQKKIVRQWVDFLPTCKKVETLWFTTQTPQQVFDSACQLDQLIGLNIKNSSITTLDNIIRLKNLKYLRIGDSSKIESIKPLESMTTLEVLAIENFKRISDFSNLIVLTNLKFLTIEGGMYTKQKIDSFDFLSELKNLTYLSMAMISTTNKSIDRIYKLKDLKTLNWPFDLTKDEMTRLKNELPNLKYLPHRHVESNLNKIKPLFK